MACGLFPRALSLGAGLWHEPVVAGTVTASTLACVPHRGRGGLSLSRVKTLGSVMSCRCHNKGPQRKLDSRPAPRPPAAGPRGSGPGASGPPRRAGTGSRRSWSHRPLSLARPSLPQPASAALCSTSDSCRGPTGRGAGVGTASRVPREGPRQGPGCAGSKLQQLCRPCLWNARPLQTLLGPRGGGVS